MFDATWLQGDSWRLITKVLLDGCAGFSGSPVASNELYDVAELAIEGQDVGVKELYEGVGIFGFGEYLV